MEPDWQQLGEMISQGVAERLLQFPELSSPWLTTKQQAAVIRDFTERGLVEWRTAGKGPPYFKLSGTTVRYHKLISDAWFFEHVVIPLGTAFEVIKPLMEEAGIAHEGVERVEKLVPTAIERGKRNTGFRIGQGTRWYDKT